MRSLLNYFIIFLLCLSFVSGETFPTYYDLRDADIGLRVQSEVSVQESSDGYLQADLRYVPRESYMQRIVSLQPFAQPSARMEQEKESIVYTWEGLQAGTYQYSVQAVVHTQHAFPLIQEKIVFPLQRLDGSLLSYTRATEFIDINSDIEAQARAIIQGEDDLYRVVYLLADWTRIHVDYSLDTLTAEAVEKSSWVLKNRRGVCDELTNLFISFLRSLGIPARFVSGSVYTNLNGQFGNHGWAEVHFPGIGWVPFDVTYGQYGWVDPTHVVLKTDVDSGTPGVFYSWSTDKKVQVHLGKITIDPQFQNTGEKISNPLALSVQPLKSRVGFGSFVPLEVRVKNLQSHYVATTVALTKAPGILGENVQGIVVEPNSETSAYWILEVPSDLDENYIYTAEIEARDGFSGSASSTLVYQAGEEVYSKSDAEVYIAQQHRRSGKMPLAGVNMYCQPQRERYSQGEEVLVQCDLSSSDRAFSLKVCMLDRCESLPLPAEGTARTSFQFSSISSGRFTVTAEDEQHILYVPVAIQVTAVPVVSIADYTPKQADYGEDLFIELVLESTVPVQHVAIDVNGNGLLLDSLQERERVRFRVNSKQLLFGLKILITYEDEVGKEYTTEEHLAFPVKNLSWWAKFKLWVYHVFT